MKATVDDNRLELLDEAECRQLLHEATVGRVGISRDALPVILPVNYAMIDAQITFWSAPGMKLAPLAQTVVAFEVDRRAQRGGGTGECCQAWVAFGDNYRRTGGPTRGERHGVAFEVDRRALAALITRDAMVGVAKVSASGGND